MTDQSEEYIQYECVQWFWNTYPGLRGLLCYNLSNSKNRIDGNRNKAMGLQPGRADLTLYYQRMVVNIEMKTQEGKQSPEQKKWEQLITQQGFHYYIVRSLHEFQTLIKLIIK